jgi:UDP-GlcNAc:undecaprenyl-phosphate/decaprenyl-phosphate GlcNAc-1-phosphate transferase
MENLLYVLTPFGFALVVTLVLLPVWITVCRKWHLFDEPDTRKHHSELIPSMGGIAIFAGIFCSFLVFSEIREHEKMRYLFGASLVLFFTGFFDDLINVKPFKKLIFQAVSAKVIYYGGISVINLDGALGIHEVPVLLHLPLTLFLVILFTNAYNFIDGVDGLAGSIGVIASSCIGALFIHYGKYDFAILSFCITGSLLGFLFFNFSPAKIFMGDTGSMVIGFLLAALAVELLNTGIRQPEIAVSPSYLFAILFIPLYDMIRVFIIRTVNGRSPFQADRSHIHHMLLGYGFGHRSVALLMASINLLIISLNQFVPVIPSNLFILLSLLVALSILNHQVLSLLSRIHHKIFGNTIENTIDS